MDHLSRRQFSINAFSAVCAAVLPRRLVVSAENTSRSGSGKRFDLLFDEGLEFHPGVERKSDGWWVFNRDLEISEQDGSPGVENLTINLAGSHFQKVRDFTVNWRFSKQQDEAVLHLCGSPPIVYDEFINMRGLLRIAIERDSLWCGIVKPKGDQSWEVEENLSITDAEDHTVRVAYRADRDSLEICVDGNARCLLPGSQLFGSGQVWFGLEANGDSAQFRLDELAIESVDQRTQEVRLIDSGISTDAAQTVTPPSAVEEGRLQNLITRRRPGFLIGAAVSLAPLASDRQYRQLASNGMFGSITTENALKAQFVHPLQDVYDWAESEAIVQYFTKHGMQIHGHALVFGEANPQWLRAMAVNTPDRILDVMQDHVATIVGHYKGRISTWDVVNEPLADYDTQPGPRGLRRHLWLRSCGVDYLKTAFETAHQADPKARLFINEFGLEEDRDRWRTMHRLLRFLLDNDVPVHGVGLQAHVYNIGDEVERDRLHGVLDEIEALGLTARVSELDVHGDQGPNVQANQFATVLDACLDHSACEALSFWGITDRYGSTSYLDNGRLRYGDGLPWDENLEPRPAVKAIQKVARARA